LAQFYLSLVSIQDRPPPEEQEAGEQAPLIYQEARIKKIAGGNSSHRRSFARRTRKLVGPF